MRVLVTGANGLVGSRLCGLLVAAGHEVTATGRGPRRVLAASRYVEADLTSAPAIEAAFGAANPELVFHPASMTEVDRCEQAPEEAYQANVVATAHVALGARRLGAHLVHVSTDYVFDGDDGPYGEEDLPNPRGVYALTKHMAEQAVRVLAPSWAIARTAVVYGWPQAARSNFGAWLVGALSQGQSVKLFTDQVVSPSLADSVAQMLAELGTRRLAGVWNVCGADALDRLSFGKALCEQFGFDPALLVPVRLRELALPSPRPLRSGLRTDKAERELSSKPLGLAEALSRFHAAYLAAQEQTT